MERPPHSGRNIFDAKVKKRRNKFFFLIPPSIASLPKAPRHATSPNFLAARRYRIASQNKRRLILRSHTDIHLIFIQIKHARDMVNIDEFNEVALRLVRQAGDIIKDRMNRPKEVMLKSCDVDLVTESDRQVEKLFMNGITEKFPDHRFIGEEATSASDKVQLTDSPTWVIDPIDGTMNFVHGLPHTCISVALLVEKVTEIGIVYNPILEQLFTAVRGKGAFLNGAPINVSGQKELAKALLMVEMGTSRDPEKMKTVFKNMQILTPKVHGIRTLGSAALNMCMVALGGADANFEFGIHIWDFGAGNLIVREAGGVCIDPAGGPLDLLSRRLLCASSSELAQEIAGLIEQHYPDRD